VAGIPGTATAVTSGYDGAVGIFDLRGGPGELLGYHDHLVNRVTVNQAGTVAASCSSDYTIRLWDIHKHSLLTTLRGHADDVEDFAFTEDGRGISVSRDHRVILWNLESGAIERIHEEHERDVLSVVVAGNTFYTSGDDMTLRQWDLQSGRTLRKWGPFEHETDTCAVDGNRGRAILGCDDGSIRIFDVRTGELEREIKAHSSGIKKVCVSPLTGDILSAAYDQKLRIWDARTLDLRVELAGAPSIWERSLNWTPDGESIVGGTFDGTVLRWNAASGHLLSHFSHDGAEPGNACFNEAANMGGGDLVLVSDDGFLRVAKLTPEAAQWKARVEPGPNRILMNAVAADAGYQVVMAGAHDHRLHIFPVECEGLGRRGVAIPLGQGPINSIRIARHAGYEGDAFVACYSGSILRVSRRGEIRGSINVHEGAVKALRIHATEPLGVSCGADGLLVSWSLDGTMLRRFPGHTAIVDDVDIDPGGTMIASAGRDFILKVHNLHSGVLLHAIRLGWRSPKSICFVDQDTVIVGDYWGTLIRADLRCGRMVRAKIARNGISSLSWSLEHLVATSYDGGVYLVAPGDLRVVNKIRAMTQRYVPAVGDDAA
jgi:WD40 repeat protein